MTRLRWLKLDWDISLSSLVERLSRDLYTPRSQVGFRVDYAMNDVMGASFIERTSFTEEVVDPSGETFVNNRLVISRVRFKYLARQSIIEIEDCPRSLSAFTNRIGYVSDFGASIQDAEVDLRVWLNRVGEQFQNQRVVELQLGGVKIAKSVVATYVLNGQEDVRAQVPKLPGAADATIERVRVAVSELGGSECVVEARQFSGLKLPTRIDDATTETLRALAIESMR